MVLMLNLVIVKKVVVTIADNGAIFVESFKMYGMGNFTIYVDVERCSNKVNTNKKLYFRKLS